MEPLMKPTASTSAVAEPRERRYEELRRTLEDRRREIDSSIRDQLSLVREERAASGQVGVLDDGEVADVDIQEDIELALVQMRLETIDRIDAALARLEAGQYGRCTKCGDDISEARLRALPFAVRCIECEESREAAARDRRLPTRRLPLFADVHVPIR
jgi:DnaK suppressor protein